MYQIHSIYKIAMQSHRDLAQAGTKDALKALHVHVNKYVLHDGQNVLHAQLFLCYNVKKIFFYRSPSTNKNLI